MSDFPWVGKSIMRYNSPHSTDLSFGADQEIRVLGPAPETDDWSLGELLESGKKGIFPKEFVVRIDPSEPSSVAVPANSESDNDPSIKPIQSSSPSAVDVPKATPMAIPSKSDDIVNQTPSPPPQNSPPTNSESNRNLLHAPTKDIAQDDMIPIQNSNTDGPSVQHARPLSPPPPPSDISTPTPAAPVTESLSLEPSHAPVQKAASPAPISASSPSAVKVGGMSASDAKESIKSGGSLKDRMAMFQQKAAPTVSGPPPIRAKPAGDWSWKNKPVMPSPSTAESSVISPTIGSAIPGSSVDTTQLPATSPASQPGGMSASDAKESITKGGSLKERMAALQGKMGGAAPAPPPVSSGKPRVWKRPEAPSAPVSEFTQPEEKKKSKWVVEEVSRDELDGSVLKSGEDSIRKNKETEENPETGTAAVTDQLSDDKEIVPEQNEVEPTEPAEEDGEEAIEKARRAAIAARMAKLGGRGMFAPPPPPPTHAVKEEVIGDSTTAQDASTPSEPSNSATTALPDQIEDNSSAAFATAPLPAMPRRAAPPRRKPNATPKASDPIPSAPNPQEVPYPKTEEEKLKVAEQEDLAKGDHGAEGAEQAGIALEVPEKGEQMEDQPLVSDEAVIEEDVPVSTATQVESINPESHIPNASSASSTIYQTEESPAVTGLDDLPIQPREDTRDVNVTLPKKQLSVPLPDRESSVNLDAAEFRQTIETPSAIGFVENEGQVQGFAASGEVSSSPEPNLEKEELNFEEPTKESPEVEERNLEEPIPSPPPPPPPPRSTVLPSLPPKTIDLSEEEEGAQTEEEGLGHSETEDPSVEEESVFVPPRRTSMLPPPPIPNLNEETDMDDNCFAEEEADAEVEVDEIEQGEAEIKEKAPPPPPARPSLPLAAHENVSHSSVSSRNTAPPPGRQRPAVPLPNIPVPAPADEVSSIPASPVRSLISSKASILASTPLPTPSASTRADSEAVDVDNSEKEATQPSEADADSEAARRQSIAARMAKLGGANQFRLFGGPPIAVQKPAIALVRDEDDGSTSGQVSTAKGTAGAVDETEEEEEEEEEEDDEVRRARARAKMVAMGGMRMGGFGISQPTSAPPPPSIESSVEYEESTKKPTSIEDEGFVDQSHQRDVIEDHESKETEPIYEPEELQEQSEPVSNEASFAPPLPLASEDYQFDVPSFEAESSAPHLTLMSSDSEKSPPPPFGRPNRDLPPLVTESLAGTPNLEATVRSPVSSSVVSPASPSTPSRRSSLKRVSGVFNARKSSDGGRPILEATEISSTDPRFQAASQTIHERQELSFPAYYNAVAPSPAVESGNPSPSNHEQLSNTELIQLSKTNGAEVLKIANSLLYQSKKSVIADGTSLGFVRETLRASHCQPPTDGGISFGHLIFHQIGKSIQARRDDIRLGDIVLIEQAHFKGKKGLVHYTIDVELENGVVMEFEAKKSKMKMGQAVGKANAYPTLEAASYKLEDLQSGSIKVFRPFG